VDTGHVLYCHINRIVQPCTILEYSMNVSTFNISL